MEQTTKNKIHTHSAGDIISAVFYRLFWVVLIVYAASMLVLPLYMLNTSLKADNLECIYNPFGLPESITWGNFKEIFVIFNEKMEVSVAGMFAVTVSCDSFHNAVCLRGSEIRFLRQEIFLRSRYRADDSADRRQPSFGDAGE